MMMVNIWLMMMVNIWLMMMVIIWLMMINKNLIGGWATYLPLWNMMEWVKVSWDYDITEWKAIKFMFQTTNQKLVLTVVHTWERATPAVKTCSFARGSCDHWTDYMLKMRLHSSRIAVLSLKINPGISHVRSYLAIHKVDSCIVFP